MKSWERLVAVFWGWVALAALGFFVAASIANGQGAKANNHAGPVPEHVHMHNPYTYTMSATDHISVGAICRDGRGGIDDGYYEATEGNARFIACYSHQTWNDKRPRSQNWPHSAVRIWHGRWFGPACAMGLIFALLAFVLPEFVREQRKRRRR